MFVHKYSKFKYAFAFNLMLIYYANERELDELGLSPKQREKLLEFSYYVRSTEALDEYAVVKSNERAENISLKYSPYTENLTLEENIVIAAHELRHVLSFPSRGNRSMLWSIILILGFCTVIFSPLFLIILVMIMPFNFFLKKYRFYLEELKAFRYESKIANIISLTTPEQHYENCVKACGLEREQPFSNEVYYRFFKGYPSARKMEIIRLRGGSNYMMFTEEYLTWLHKTTEEGLQTNVFGCFGWR